nr:MAG TPA: hypothetical protein [Caudoviricetes sp.]
MVYILIIIKILSNDRKYVSVAFVSYGNSC